MSATKNDLFYSRLPVNQIPLSDLLTEEHLFYKIPEDWQVIITDIKNSTDAIRRGRHETVNLIATGSIVTILNIALKVDITLPFFFGGDGATFILPATLAAPVSKALQLYQANTLENFGLELRIGTVPVQDIYRKGYELRISKFRSSAIFAIPVLLGNGLNYAEQLIKGSNSLLSADAGEGELDLSGMQCRWDKIAPPEDGQEVVTLLITVPEHLSQDTIFGKVMCHIDELYGTPEKRQPISVPKLRMKTTFNRLRVEMKARMGKWHLWGVTVKWITTLLGALYFRTAKGKTYLHRLVDMSDTLVIDGKINTVISGTKQQRLLLLQVLDELEQRGEITYGFFVSKESVMSCYVRDLQEGHIHFVDGSEGGYTMAAGLLKQKLRQQRSQ